MLLKNVELGALSYFEAEIASKATGFQKFLLFTGGFLGLGQAENLINKHSDVLVQMGLYNPDTTEIDIDKLYNSAKSGIQKSGQFEYKGIIFSESDIDKLYAHIKKQGG